MPIVLSDLRKGDFYSRHDLAEMWGYSSFHAISRGVVTPSGENKIILFVTEEKQVSAEQYSDRLIGDVLEWEGPKDHFAESRMANIKGSADEIHLFYRNRHHSDFTYLGQVEVIKYIPHRDKPSQFEFRLA